jgi:hypothetical protein
LASTIGQSQTIHQSSTNIVPETARVGELLLGTCVKKYPQRTKSKFWAGWDLISEWSTRSTRHLSGVTIDNLLLVARGQ